MKKKKRNRVKSFDTGDRVLVMGKDNKPKYNGLCGIVISHFIIDDSPCYEVYIPGYKEDIIKLGDKAWTSNFLCSADSLVPYKEPEYTFSFEVADMPGIPKGFFDDIEDRIAVCQALECQALEWEDYEKSVARDIAVAYAQNGSYESNEIGHHAAIVARSLVDNLKHNKR